MATSVCVRMCVCVCVCVCFIPFVRTWALNSKCKVDQVDFTDCMPFLPCHHMKEISANPEAVRGNI